MDDILIPSQTFSEPFPKILNKIDGVITKTERKLLILFNNYCYKDGLIFPKQKTIAYKLGISKRQVKRLIKSLQEKMFIKVIPSNLNDRHLYGKGNTYSLLNHALYQQESKKISKQMSPEMSPCDGNVSFIRENNKKLKSSSDFNIVEFLKKNQKKHGQAIIDALNALTKRWPSIKFHDQYAQKIVDIQSGNYNAVDYEQESKEEVQEINTGYAKIAEKMGFNLNSMDRYQKEENSQEIAQRMNSQRNKIFEMFR